MNKAKVATAIAAGAIGVIGLGAVAASASAQAESPRAQIKHEVVKLTEPTAINVTNNTWEPLKFAPAAGAPVVVAPGGSVQVDATAFTGTEMSGKVVYPHGKVTVKASSPVVGNPLIKVGNESHRLTEGKGVTFTQGTHSIDADRGYDDGAMELQLTINS